MRYSSLGGMICRTTKVVVGTGGGTSCSSPQDEDDNLAECVGRKNSEKVKSEETGEEDLVVVLGRRDELGSIGPGLGACEKDARGERELCRAVGAADIDEGEATKLDNTPGESLSTD